MKKIIFCFLSVSFLLVCSSCKSLKEEALSDDYDDNLLSFCTIMTTCQQKVMTPEQKKMLNISKDDSIKQCMQGMNVYNISKRYAAVPECERINKAVQSAGLKCQKEVLMKYDEDEMCRIVISPDEKYQKELSECTDKYKNLAEKQEKCVCDHLDVYIEDAKATYLKMGIKEFTEEQKKSLMMQLSVQCK